MSYTTNTISHHHFCIYTNKIHSHICPLQFRSTNSATLNSITQSRFQSCFDTFLTWAKDETIFFYIDLFVLFLFHILTVHEYTYDSTVFLPFPNCVSSDKFGSGRSRNSRWKGVHTMFDFPHDKYDPVPLLITSPHPRLVIHPPGLYWVPWPLSHSLFHFLLAHSNIALPWTFTTPFRTPV